MLLLNFKLIQAFLLRDDTGKFLTRPENRKILELSPNLYKAVDFKMVDTNDASVDKDKVLITYDLGALTANEDNRTLSKEDILGFTTSQHFSFSLTPNQGLIIRYKDLCVVSNDDDIGVSLGECNDNNNNNNKEGGRRVTGSKEFFRVDAENLPINDISRVNNIRRTYSESRVNNYSAGPFGDSYRSISPKII